ncbi:MAG TPA: hypothetical protein VEU74_12130 [Gemmatimonadales bacterium]|nr:hypothetical protein [Gemmatimonadales bacterium]
MLPLPLPETGQNVRALARVEREDFTGIAASTITLTQNPIEAAAAPGTSQYIRVFKNGLYLHNLASADFTVAGKVLTFAVALIAGDKVSVEYYARAN